MKYIMVFVVLLLSVNAQAQVAQITREGTTVFTENGEVFTPNEQTVARQKMLQEQQARQAKQAAEEAYQRQMQNNMMQQQNAQANNQRNTQKMKMGKSLLSVYGNQKTALDLLILQEVATYKLDDANIKKDVEELENNQEYYRKLETIKSKLTNDKFPDSLNKEILRILDDTGNRLNNLLGN